MTPTASSSHAHRGVLVVAALLVVAVVAVYAPIRDAGFVSLDDQEYVTDNPFVRVGLTGPGVRHALWGSRGALWMPLAFVSHMVDVHLFGLSPAGPHLVNVGLHAANAVLLLLLLVRTTGAFAPSAAVAVLFALHPLRVESVAWIAERKDVLSACFGLLTLHAWVSYARRPRLGRYLAVVLALLLALLAKPMLVSVPVLLFLMDFWPLRRLDTPTPDGRRVTLGDLVLEKIPLLLLAAGTAALTLITVREYDALASLSERSLATRIVHAAASYVWYVGKTLWPADLAVFYPYPAWSAWQIGVAVACLAAAAAGCVVTRRRAPWIAMGTAWFVIALFPVIGLFQAGSQGMADRFTYIPGIGLLVAMAWTLDAAVRTRRPRALLGGAVAVVTVALAILSARQVRVWHDSETLYRHTLAVTENNWSTHADLGNVLLESGRLDEAYAHFETAYQLEPRATKTSFGLGLAASAYGRLDEAERYYRRTIELDYRHAKAHNNLGVLMFDRSETDAGLHHLSEAASVDDPNAREAASNLRLALLRLGIPDADAYVKGLATWPAAVEADRERPGGAKYGAGVAGQLLAPRVEAVRTCLGTADGRAKVPFNIYVAIGPDGALQEVAPLPPTRVARCLGDELRAARASAPPFAPFHAQVSMRIEG
jgi:protein O-mannosyl-transferase